MADEVKKDDPKTETVGYLSKDKLKTMKGWPEYEAKAAAFAKAKAEAATAKTIIRDAIKSKLKLEGDIDFTDDDERIRVFKNLQKKPGRKGVDLSASF